MLYLPIHFHTGGGMSYLILKAKLRFVQNEEDVKQTLRASKLKKTKTKFSHHIFLCIRDLP